MKLYYHPISINCRKALMVAAVLGIDLELQLLDVGKGAHGSPEYLAINPNGMIPTLEDDGFVLWESNAIAQYLTSKSATSALFPSDRQLRADVSRWQFWDVAHWSRPVQTLAFERLYKRAVGLGEPETSAVEKAIRDFHQFAAVLNSHLDGREFIVGKGLTLADLSIASGLTFAGPAALPVAQYKSVQRWFASIERLDAWKRTAPAGDGLQP